MKRLTDRKIVVVTRPTRLEDLVEKHNSAGQAKFYVERQGGDFSDIKIEDDLYQGAINRVERTLESLGLAQRVKRRFLPNFVFGPMDIVVVVGQDGLVANTVKYLNGQPLIGVNPDPTRWIGQLLPFDANTLGEAAATVLLDRAKTREVTLAIATLNDGQELLAVNDLFIGPKSHTSAFYDIRFDGKKEQQSSSGIIVSTGLGSTGWLKSIVAGAKAIHESQNGTYIPNRDIPNTEFTWDAKRLVFNVREPFPTPTTGINIVHGKVTPERNLIVTSKMSEHGVIFSDGIEEDFLEFNSGAEVTVSIADQKGNLVV